MKKLFTLTLILSSLLAQAQYFPVGNGLPEQPFGIVFTAESQTDFYVGYQKATSPNDAVFYRWNGLFWQSLPEIKGASLTSIEVYQKTLYVTTDLNNGFGSPNKLRFFDGSQWQDITPGGITGPGITELKAYPDSNWLVLGGNFQIPSAGASKVAYYNGSYRSFPSLPVVANGANDSISSLNIINNEIWVGGRFGIKDSLNLVKLTNGSTWDFPAKFYQGTTLASPFDDVRSIFSANGSTYATEGNNLYKILNDTAYQLGPAEQFTNFTTNSYGAYFTTQYPGTIGVATGFVYYFEDVSESIQQAAVPSGESYGVGLKDSVFFVFPYGNPPNIIYNNVAANYVYSTQNAITRFYGRTYLDVNGNCVYDTLLDDSLTGVGVSLTGSVVQQFRLSSSDGRYYFNYLQPGTFNLNLNPGFNKTYKNLTASCNPPASISLSQGQALQTDIGFTHNGNTDFSTEITGFGGWRMRQGFAENYELELSNPGISTSSMVSVELALPSNITLNQASPPAASVSGNTYTWNFVGLQQFDERKVSLSLTAPVSSTNLGDTLDMFARIITPATDDDPSDNTDTLKVRVVGAYDPNDKQVSKPFIAPGTRQLDYQIRFQNTGNDTAYRVVVVDTLDTSLPISKIVMNSASHAYSISAQGNILVWTFNNILLPDSTTDLAGSQGYIRFSAEIDPNLGLGDSVLNDAQIYFDFQKPIFTNKAKTLIVENIGLPENEGQPALQIYPNPASERFIIKNPGNKTQNLKVINIGGQLIMERILQAQEMLEINTANLKNGIYFVTSNNSTFKLIVKH